jgi:hypothetical protein
MHPADLAWARGATDIGYDRHPLPDGNHYDPTLDVLRVTGPSGSMIAVVFSTACHPVFHANHNAVSPDFPGVARSLIETKFGGISLFLQGYAGTCNPQDYDVVIGPRLADQVGSLLLGPMDDLSGPIDAWLTEIDLPLQPLDHGTLPRWINLAQANSQAVTDQYALIGRWAAYMQSLGSAIPTTLPTPLQAIRIGTTPSACYIVASGHEIATEFGPLVRSRWPAPRVTVIGYSNAQLSYVPSAAVLLNPDSRALFPDASQMQNYEGGVAFLWYGHPGLLTTDVDTVFLQGHSDLIKQIFVPPRQVSLSLSPETVIAGDTAIATVTLDNPPFAGSAVINLSTISPGFAIVPPQVTILPGQTSAPPVTIQTLLGSIPIKTTKVRIDASYQGSSATATLTVKSRIIAGVLNSLTVSPPTVTGGQAAHGTVSLVEPVRVDTHVGLLALEPGSGPLGLGGTHSSIASVPPSVTIPSGATTRDFIVTTNRNFPPTPSETC